MFFAPKKPDLQGIRSGRGSSPEEEVGDTLNINPFCLLDSNPRQASVDTLRAAAGAGYKSNVAVTINCRGSTMRYALAVPSG